MKANNEITKIDFDFAKKAASDSGVDLFACYQCGKCTNGCPVTFAMDYLPHQIIRMVQLGLSEEILHARSMWICASCETCFTRCPNEIDIPKLMDYIKRWTLSQEEKPVERSIVAFHQAFLRNIRRFGRINEVFLMGSYQLKTAAAEKKINAKEIFSNLKLGLQMLKRGRLSFISHKTGGKEAVRKLFKK
ncbi:MAG: 4Fe-4S dicluster domain-containing protein [Deltaproteobacteria bacterium]|nr:4Fe-4S dicluster domain-containing protein [Deltaproteobacteria bacterium]MBW2660587.1 4Fe-4S dicluster domain-containing protein [Deltaproteobacteria bacterium]